MDSEHDAEARHGADKLEADSRNETPDEHRVSLGARVRAIAQFAADNPNPYWHPETKPHVIETQEVERLCLDCLHIMLASHTVVTLDLDDDGIPTGASRLRQLHLANAEKMLSRAMLQIAVLVRTFDDQQMQYGDEDYIAHVKAIDAEGPFATAYDGSDDELGIRECCNKIIHAEDFRPVYERDDDVEVIWYMDSQIELEGHRGKKAWAFTLHTIGFLEAVLDLIAYDPDAEPAKPPAGPAAG